MGCLYFSTHSGQTLRIPSKLGTSILDFLCINALTVNESWSDALGSTSYSHAPPSLYAYQHSKDINSNIHSDPPFICLHPHSKYRLWIPLFRPSAVRKIHLKLLDQEANESEPLCPKPFSQARLLLYDSSSQSWLANHLIMISASTLHIHWGHFTYDSVSFSIPLTSFPRIPRDVLMTTLPRQHYDPCSQSSGFCSLLRRYTLSFSRNRSIKIIFLSSLPFRPLYNTKYLEQ